MLRQAVITGNQKSKPMLFENLNSYALSKSSKWENPTCGSEESIEIRTEKCAPHLM